MTYTEKMYYLYMIREIDIMPKGYIDWAKNVTIGELLDIKKDLSLKS